MRQLKRGFTLIELIVVMIVLGVLAATALPKFMSLSGEARIATLEAARGALTETAAIAHGKFLTVNPAPTSITVEGALITFSTVAASGYPRADSGLAAAAGLSPNHYTLIAAGTAATANSPATSATEVAFIPVSVAGTPSGLTCFVKYAEAVSTITAPTVLSTTTGC